MDLAEMKKWRDGFPLSLVVDRRFCQLIDEVERLTDQNLRILRKEFTQICSYCGFEFPAEGAYSWEDLQAHIHVCPHHPVGKLRAERDMLKAQVEFDCSTHQCDKLFALAEPYIQESIALAKERDELRESVTAYEKEANDTLTFYREKGRVTVANDGNPVQRLGASAEIAIIKAEAQGFAAGMERAVEIASGVICDDEPRNREWNDACDQIINEIRAAIPATPTSDALKGDKQT